jgi:hypothetical protein
MYMRARSLAADALAEEAVSIARQSRSGVVTSEQVAADRLAYDALRWLAGKRRPKDYGDRVEHQVSGTIGHLHLDALRLTKPNATNEIAAVVNTDARLALGQRTYVEGSETPIRAIDAESLRDAAEAPPSSSASTGSLEGGIPLSAAGVVSGGVGADSSPHRPTVVWYETKLPWSATAVEKAAWRAARVAAGLDPLEVGFERGGV